MCRLTRSASTRLKVECLVLVCVVSVFLITTGVARELLASLVDQVWGLEYRSLGFKLDNTIQQLSSALMLYQSLWNGVLPYDARGEEYALYGLRKLYIPMMSGLQVRTFDWDDENERVTNCLYDYVNQPDLRLVSGAFGPDVPNIVVIAEKLDGSNHDGYVRYVTTKGDFWAVKLRQEQHNVVRTLVGRSQQELQGMVAEALVRGHLDFDPRRWYGDEHQMDRFASRPFPDEFRSNCAIDAIADGLVQYQARNGVLPYDPRGPEYALYGLRDAYIVQQLPLERWGITPLEWDEVQGKVVDLRYDYVNRPGSQLGAAEPDIVVLATRLQFADRTGIRVFTSRGYVEAVRLADNAAAYISSVAGLPFGTVRAMTVEVRYRNDLRVSDNLPHLRWLVENPGRTGNRGRQFLQKPFWEE